MLKNGIEKKPKDYQKSYNFFEIIGLVLITSPFIFPFLRMFLAFMPTFVAKSPLYAHFWPIKMATRIVQFGSFLVVFGVKKGIFGVFCGVFSHFLRIFKVCGQKPTFILIYLRKKYIYLKRIDKKKRVFGHEHILGSNKVENVRLVIFFNFLKFA